MSAMPFDKILEWMTQIGTDATKDAIRMVDDFKYYRQVLLSSSSSIDEIYDAWIDLQTRYERKFPPSMQLFNTFHKIISKIQHINKSVNDTLRRDLHFKNIRKDFKSDDDETVNMIFSTKGETVSSLQEMKDSLLLEWKETVVRLVDSMDMRIIGKVSISQAGSMLSDYENSTDGDDDIDEIK